MTRAPTYPIHRNRRNSISIRFSVRSIRFSRCGLKGRSALALPPRSRSAARRYITPLAGPSQGQVPAPQGLHNQGGGRGAGARGLRGHGPHGCLHICMRRGSGRLDGLALAPAKKRRGRPEAAPYGAKKRPARARLPILPQPGAAVLSATAGLTAEFGTGSGDPRLHGLARAGRSSCGTLAAAWRPIGRSDRAGHARRYV